MVEQLEIAFTEPIKVYLEGKEGHYLKCHGMGVVMILKTLRHGSCVACGYPVSNLEEAANHWYEMLGIPPEV
ncbi:MAG: hypothetical protein HY096_09805 [Nitrospinae bacterium]|nr:hypothetical protein [Nitrospinota bacterium]